MVKELIDSGKIGKVLEYRGRGKEDRRGGAERRHRDRHVIETADHVHLNIAAPVIPEAERAPSPRASPTSPPAPSARGEGIPAYLPGCVTSTFTTPNQARWIAEMWAYASNCYPEMTWLETLEAQEDAQLSFSQANTLLTKYGEDIDGIFGMTSVATPSSADAVTQADLCGEVAVIGLATPNAMKPYVETECVQSVVLWNPIDLGYAAVYVMRAVVDGELQPGDTTVNAGRLGELTIVNGSEVLLGAPFIFTAENINDFDF